MSKEKQRGCPTCGCELYKEQGPCEGSELLDMFVDSLKEYYNTKIMDAEDLLAFAVQRLDEIKGQK
jgi:hypothetical protein